MCSLPTGLIERALVQRRSEQLLVIAKSLELSRPTCQVLLLMLQAGEESVFQDQIDPSFAALPGSVRRLPAAPQFYRLRERANG